MTHFEGYFFFFLSLLSKKISFYQRFMTNRLNKVHTQNKNHKHFNRIPKFGSRKYKSQVDEQDKIHTHIHQECRKASTE